MATTRKPKFDFDAVLATYDEDAAIAALAAKTRVEYVIVEDRFIGRFGDGTIVEMPLKVSVEIIDSLEGIPNPVDQLKAILTSVGGEKATESILVRDIAEVTLYSTLYFGALQRKVRASLPES